MPAAPSYDGSAAAKAAATPLSPDGAGVNLQSSGQLYNNNNNGDNNNNNNNNGNGRKLNLLDDEKYIPPDGQISYYDEDADSHYLDGSRVKISNTEFANNRAADSDRVSGIVTSAYSLSMSGCCFANNDAKAMVFVYNDEAVVEDTVFVGNTVEVSTIILASPKKSKKNDGADATAPPTPPASASGSVPTHVVQRTCFVNSNVGMSNVLVTDVESTTFGQSDNHASGRGRRPSRGGERLPRDGAV